MALFDVKPDTVERTGEEFVTLKFETTGLLEPGLLDATIVEIELAFGRSSARRAKIFRDLTLCVNELKTLPWSWELLVDGSFVMPMVTDPNDVDVVLVLGDDWQLHEDLSAELYALLSRDNVRARYDIDVVIARAHSPEKRKWEIFFGQVNRKWTRQFGWAVTVEKGLVRIVS